MSYARRPRGILPSARGPSRTHAKHALSILVRNDGCVKGSAKRQQTRLGRPLSNPGLNPFGEPRQFRVLLHSTAGEAALTKPSSFTGRDIHPGHADDHRIVVCYEHHGETSHPLESSANRAHVGEVSVTTGCQSIRSLRSHGVRASLTCGFSRRHASGRHLHEVPPRVTCAETT